jgi:hypothetical protein
MGKDGGKLNNINIFSGDDSRELWKKIRKTKPGKLRWLLFDICCRLQRLESKIGLQRKGAK